MKQNCLQAILVSVGLFVLATGARAALSAFVWADAQPPTIATSTELSFTDPVFNTQVTLTALNGATFTSHAFDPTFPSLPSPLGPLGTGKEDFAVNFPSGLSIADILVTANMPVLDSAGDIIDAEVTDGATRIGTEERTSTGVTFTEQLNEADSLDFSLTNFLFSTVPETGQLPVTVAVCLLAVGSWAFINRKANRLRA